MEKCPHCGKETSADNNLFRPFCSKRCKLIDLGAWISGTYRIPEQNEDDDSDNDSIDEKGFEQK
jgi:uncharacterized protein